MQTFDKLFLSEASDTAFAGETTDIDTTNTISKLSNLFFIFPLLLFFVFVDGFYCQPQNFFSFWRVDKATTNQHPPKNFFTHIFVGGERQAMKNSFPKWEGEASHEELHPKSRGEWKSLKCLPDMEGNETIFTGSTSFKLNKRENGP